MIRKYLITFLFCWGIIIPLSGQLDDAEAFEMALQAMEVHNPAAYLPLKDLQDKKIAFIQSPGHSFPYTLKYLNQYTSVAAVSPTDDLSFFNELIIGLPADLNLLSAANRAQLVLLAASYPSTLVFFGEKPEEEKKLNPFKNVKATIWTMETPVGQSLAAQYIFGGIGADLSWSGPRLGYGPPELVQMNATLLRDSIAAIVKEGIRAQAYPGAQVLVAHQGKIVYQEAFGYHTYDSLQAVRNDDVYDLASVTKVSSALAALMKWQGEGQFDLNATLADYYPDFKNSNKGDLPFRQMLAHNARLRSWIPYWQGTLKKQAKYPWKNRWSGSRTNDYRFKRRTLSKDSSAAYSIYLSDGLYQHRDFKEQMMKAIKKSPLNENPGYTYSGLLFYLLPDIVGQKAGMDYETFLKQTFYQPLGANSITYNPLRFYGKDRIVPTERDTFFRMTQIHGYVHDEGAAMMGGVSANAGLFSSANDLAKLFQMYMNYGEYGGERYIAASAVKEFARCQYCGEGNHRGLGFDKPLIEYDAVSSSVAQKASPDSFGHSGYTGTFVWVDPEADLLFVFLSNRVYPTRLNRKLYQLNIRPRIHKVLYDALETK
jgi:CubicO group peptidase (beta-lactamase class C family)